MVAAAEKKFGPKSKEVDILKESFAAQKKGKGAGQYEGIGDIWKRLQSATMRPEMKYRKELLDVTKKLQEDAEKTRQAIESIRDNGIAAAAGA